MPLGARGTCETNTTRLGALKPAIWVLTPAITSCSLDVAPGATRGDGGDRLPERLVVDADHEAVDDAVDALDGFLDLLGEDLLAAGVDHVAAAAEQDQRAVGATCAMSPGNE